jgi:hypothetical protein
LIVARYGFWDAEQDDDAAFDRRLGAVLREVGDRGKLVLSEAVPPSFREPTPAPAPAPTPTPAHAPAPARGPAQASAPTAPTATITSSMTPRTDAPQQSYTPSMQQHNRMPISTLGTERQGGTTAADVSGSFAQTVTFMREEREHLHQMMEKQKAEVERLLERDAEAKAENDKLRAEAADKRVEAVAARLRDQQLIAFQARLEALSAAKLLSDDELFAVEDVIGDSGGEASGDDQVAMLLALSARMATDSAFARQLRRKVVAQ